MRRYAAILTAAMAGLLAFSAPGASACGRVTIAEMNWASAELAAHVDKFILENGYGCDVALVPGDTMPTTASMTGKGEPDVAPELWMNSVREAVDRAVGEGRLEIAGEILSDGAVEGWWIPRYMLEEHPELTTVAAVLKRPDLFPNPEDPSRGALYNCPSGWNCQIITENLYRAYDADKAGFDLVDTGAAAGLDGSIARAFNRKQPWLGYYWAPTPVLAKYDMVRLDMGVPHDRAEWDRCTGQAGCADPEKNDWGRSEVVTVTSSGFAETAREAFEYLSRRSWPNRTLDTMLAHMDETRARGAEAAEKFLVDNEDLWTRWVPADVAGKVKAAL